MRFLVEERDIRGWGVETVGTDAGQAFAFEPPFPAAATAGEAADRVAAASRWPEPGPALGQRSSTFCRVRWLLSRTSRMPRAVLLLGETMVLRVQTVLPAILAAMSHAVPGPRFAPHWLSHQRLHGSVLIGQLRPGEPQGRGAGIVDIADGAR